MKIALLSLELYQHWLLLVELRLIMWMSEVVCRMLTILGLHLIELRSAVIRALLALIYICITQ